VYAPKASKLGVYLLKESIEKKNVVLFGQEGFRMERMREMDEGVNSSKITLKLL
jgi:hypothetical protein